MALAASAARPRTARPARARCWAPGRTIDAPVTEGGRYGRMFADLPAATFDGDRLLAVGRAGDIGGGVQCHCDSEGGAGPPLCGMYVAQDITADRSPLRAHADINVLRNVRSPRANLEGLYGGGPVGSPYLFDQADSPKLLTGVNGDLPRNQQGIALIGDPRNDVHAFMTGLQLAFIRAHNQLVDRLRADGVPDSDLFEDARLALVWHYQWVILHDFLPTLVGNELTATVLQEGPRFYRLEGEPYIPVEFADAAYRYGHSQIKADYQLQHGGPRRPVFPDLAGFRPLAPDHAVEWQLLFDVPGQPPAPPAKPLDGQLPASPIRPPASITSAVGAHPPRALAARAFQRGQGTGLPSGEAVAPAVGAKPLTRAGLALGDWRGAKPRS